MEAQERRSQSERLSLQADFTSSAQDDVAADDEDGSPLQAWRGMSLAADVASGVVPSSAVPPPSPSPSLLSANQVDIGLGPGGGRHRRCGSNKLLQHTRIQLWKNSVTALRHPGLTTMQLLAFAIFVFLLFLLQTMGKSRLMAEELHPPIAPLGPVPRCVPFNGAPCTTLLYSPAGHPEVEFIMAEVAREQGLTGEDIRPVNISGAANWTQ